MPNFTTLLQRTKIAWDIIVLTECWLPSVKHIMDIDNFNYTTTTKHKTQNEGVVAYYNKRLQITTEEALLQDANGLILKLGTETCVIGIYRPPGRLDTANFINSLDTMLTNLRGYKNIVLCGDINIDIHPNGSDKRAQDYLDLLASHAMLPGHMLNTHGRTCLDHLMVKTKLKAICAVMPASITDHDCVAFNLLTKRKVQTFNKWPTKIDFKLLDEHIQTIEFSTILNSSDTNFATNTLVTSLSSAIKLSTVQTKSPRRKLIFKPWITKGLLKCMRNRDLLHKKLKRDPDNDILRVTYKRYRGFCCSILKKAKQDYDRQEIDKAGKNSKQLWKTIKEITGTNRPSDHSLSLLATNDPSQSVNRVNNFFANVGKELAEEIERNNHSSTPDPALTSDLPTSPPLGSLALEPVDEREIALIINDMRDTCSVGIDQISNRVVKRYASILVTPLTHICNLSLSSGIFPSAFKTGLIKPIYKGGDKEEVNNFRPISILPTLSKIIERVINSRLNKYLENNSILATAQYGFRKGISTSDAVHDIIHSIVKELDDSKKCLVIFLDVAKAFDTVSIPRLLKKLERVGVRGTPLQLLKDYLSGRRQRVNIGGRISDEAEVLFGVPQGSVISPTLFLIYINDLCQIQLKEGKIFTFADDTALFFRGNTWGEVFLNAQVGLDRITKWMRTNLLSLNTSKTKFVPFAIRSSQLPPPSHTIIAHKCISPPASAIACNCPTLERTNCVKYLGIALDHKLSFKPHIEALASRVRKLIYIFKTLKHVANRDLIKTIYFSLCHSLIEYCITSWGGAAKSHMLVVERAQRALLKVAAGLPYRHPTDDLYRGWDVLTVRGSFILRTLLRTHTQTPYVPGRLEGKRRKGAVCSAQKYNTTFAHRFSGFLGNYLYNKINTSLNIYPLTKFKAQQIVTIYLKTLCYVSMEESLHPLQ